MSGVSHPTPLLEARDLSKHFVVGQTIWPGSGRTVHAVDRVSLTVHPGETLGLVGESGCGKSTLGRCLTRLYGISGGELSYAGRSIGRATPRELRFYRREVQMIFQDPSASLNPRRMVGEILGEPLRFHAIRPRAAVKDRLVELMGLVGLPAEVLDRYPHEFSGGQRQRIGIARALVMEPKLIVADEPVSALDVSVKAQIVNLFADLRERLSLTYIFISHDLALVRQVSTRIAVMYLGSIVELGDTDTVYRRPAHPYTEALLSAIPEPRLLDRSQRIILQGDLPSPLDPPRGCKFSTRCPFADDRCGAERPVLRTLADGRSAACHYPRHGGEHASAGKPLQARNA